MNPSQTRTVVGALIALTIVGWSWSFDQRTRNKQVEESLVRVLSQQDKLAQLRPPTEARVRQRQVDQLADNERVLRAAAGFGSDARNLAAALGRVKALCVAAGMVDCQVRRSSSAISSSIVGQPLEPRPGSGTVVGTAGPTRLPRTERLLNAYPVSLLATFDPKGLGDFLHRLQSLDLLYRLDRILIAQNRMELEVVFLHSNEVRPNDQLANQSPKPASVGALR